MVIKKGVIGQTYNIGGHNKNTNLQVVKAICELLDKYLPDSKHIPHESLIKFVPDRQGHDLRYAIDPSKIRTDLRWVPDETFDMGIEKTVLWYLHNSEWCRHVRDGGV